MNANLNSDLSGAEWQVRVDLAACYRIVAHFGWDDLIFTHISARVPGPERHILINPFGLLFEEVTASSLVKIDLDGNKVLESPYEVNRAGYMIHSAVHEARDDAHCVIHLHTKAGVAVAAQRDGLLPVTQQAMFAVADIAYHDYEGVVLDDDEKGRLVADLDDHKYMILRNHGLLTCGRNVSEAFFAMYFLNTACEIQVMAQTGNAALTAIPKTVIDAMQWEDQRAPEQVPASPAWPGLLRRMDRVSPGYDT